MFGPKVINTSQILNSFARLKFVDNKSLGKPKFFSLSSGLGLSKFRSSLSSSTTTVTRLWDSSKDMREKRCYSAAPSRKRWVDDDEENDTVIKKIHRQGFREAMPLGARKPNAVLKSPLGLVPSARRAARKIQEDKQGMRSILKKKKPTTSSSKVGEVEVKPKTVSERPTSEQIGKYKSVKNNQAASVETDASKRNKSVKNSISEVKNLGLFSPMDITPAKEKKTMTLPKIKNLEKSKSPKKEIAEKSDSDKEAASNEVKKAEKGAKQAEKGAKQKLTNAASEKAMLNQQYISNRYKRDADSFDDIDQDIRDVQANEPSRIKKIKVDKCPELLTKPDSVKIDLREKPHSAPALFSVKGKSSRKKESLTKQPQPTTVGRKPDRAFQSGRSHMSSFAVEKMDGKMLNTSKPGFFVPSKRLLLKNSWMNDVQVQFKSDLSNETAKQPKSNPSVDSAQAKTLPTYFKKKLETFDKRSSRQFHGAARLSNQFKDTVIRQYKKSPTLKSGILKPSWEMVCEKEEDVIENVSVLEENSKRRNLKTTIGLKHNGTIFKPKGPEWRYLLKTNQSEKKP